MVDRPKPVVRSIERTPARVVVVCLGLLTSAIHFYAGATAGEPRFLVMGAGLLSGVAIFVTRLWEPVLYLVGAIYVTVLLTVWILAGTPRVVLGAVDAIVQVALVGTFLYLFARELPRADE